AEIYLSVREINSFTDVNGSFKFSKLSENNYTLMVKHIGFEDYSTTVKLNQGEHKKLAIKLNPRPQYLKEIIIEGDIYKDLIISKLPYIETKVFKKQVEESAARDVGDFLRSSNNISGIRKGGTQLDPVVRGFKYSQLNVQVDNGLKIEGGCPNRMDPATAHIEINDIEEIEVFKGLYALKYGPSFGGVINMKTVSHKTMDTANIHVHAMSGYESNWNGNKQQIGIKGGNKFLFFNISGGRKDYGNYKDGNGNEVKSEFHKYNYRAKIGVRPVKNHLFIFNYDESKGRDIRFPTLPMDERTDDTRLISFDYQGQNISESFKSISLKIYNSDVTHEMDNKNRPFSDTTVAISKIIGINTGARTDLHFNFNQDNLQVGADLEQIKKDGERTKYMIKQPGLPIKKEQLWNNGLINNVGVFTEYTKQINRLEIIGAIRFDFNQARSDEIEIQDPMLGEIYYYGTDSIQSTFSNFSFSLGLTQEFNKNLSLSLALGRGVRSPDMIERFIILLPIGYDKFDYLGNPKLKPEANNQVDLTLKYTNPKIGLLQVNGFYSLVNNYITGKILPPSVQKPLSKDVLGVKQFYNAGNARLRGFEFSYATPVKFKLGAQLFASYTYATLDKVNKYVLNDQGQVVDEVELTNDALTEIPPLESTLILYYKLFKGKFTPKAKLRVVAAQNHISEASYEQETPGFMIAGLYFSFIFNKYFNLSAGVDNLFDNAYYEHLNRNIIGSNTNLYEPGRVFYFNLMFNI
ncbi:MAG: TonB-dependent receptor, partial [Bacteroidales bacterium]|nr:TonB-dependent receptor [Bacteroidales bacterium]